MPSLKDIARLAQVSNATVSRALRGHPNVEAATAKRVLEAAETLGYHASPRISGLMSYVRAAGATSFREPLAFVWPDAGLEEIRDTPQLRRFETGARARAESQGYGLDIFYRDGRPRPWERLRKILRARNIRGIIWGSPLRSSHAHLSMS